MPLAAASPLMSSCSANCCKAARGHAGKTCGPGYEARGLRARLGACAVVAGDGGVCEHIRIRCQATRRGVAAQQCNVAVARQHAAAGAQRRRVRPHRRQPLAQDQLAAAGRPARACTGPRRRLCGRPSNGPDLASVRACRRLCCSWTQSRTWGHTYG